MRTRKSEGGGIDIGGRSGVGMIVIVTGVGAGAGAGARAGHVVTGTDAVAARVKNSNAARRVPRHEAR